MVSNWLPDNGSIHYGRNSTQKTTVFLRVLLWDYGFNGSFTSIIVAV